MDIKRVNQIKRLTWALCMYPFLAWSHTVLDVRVWPEPDNTRVVFDLSGPIAYSVFELQDPPRLVLDLKKAEVNPKVSRLSWGRTPIKSMRYGPYKGEDIRVVFDLQEALTPRAFQLKPSGEYGHRLVIDLQPKVAHKAAPAPVLEKVAKVQSKDRTRQEVFIVAIDAGHGGEDSGAVGPSGTREKDIVLSIARKLYQELLKEPGMKPVMIRNGDYYVGLRQRVMKARKEQADLFISIHADAFKHPRAEGASVFTLSGRGASSEAARWLAESENRSDLVGGVSLDDKDDVLASVLLDLSQTASKESSLALASAVLKNIGKITELHGDHVQQAGFAVLKSPDIPSILVETEFISNPRSERKLRSAEYQDQVVKSLHDGIKVYLKNKAHQYQGLPVLQTASKTH